MIFRFALFRSLVLTLCSLVLCTYSFGQNATLSGILLDGDGKPVSDVAVGIPGTSYATTTDINGAYSLEIPSDKEVMIVFRHISFEPQSRTLVAVPGERLKFDSQLRAAATDIKTFTKTAERDRHKPMQRIEVSDVRLNPSVTGSIESLLPSRALGVSNSNELSSQYNVRGGNFDENLIYVNGVQIYRPFLVRSGQQEGLSFINSDLVSNISFSSGGFESRFGDKLSSVLDITYKKPETFAASASAGLLGANAHLETATKNKRFTQLHGMRYFSNQYLLNSLDSKGDYKPFFVDYQTYLTFTPNTDWEFSFLGNYSQNKYQFVPRTREASFGTISNAIGLKVYFQGQEVDNYQTGFGAFTTTWTPQHNLKIKWINSMFKTRESETFDIEGAYRLSELETDLSKEDFGNDAFTIGTGSYLQHGRNYLNANVYSTEIQGELLQDHGFWYWGLKYQRDDISDQLSEWRMVDSAGFSTPYNNSQGVNLFETIKSDNRLATNRLMGYAQRDWNWQLDSNTIFLTTGCRFHYWDLNNQTTVSPRAQLAFQPNWKADWMFRASWGYYHQPAFYRELRNLYGALNTDVRAQTSIHYVLGADYTFSMFDRPFKFVTESYYKQLKNIIPYELDNVRIRYYATNNAVGYATGIDTKLYGEFVKGIDSWVSLSVMKTFEDITDDQYFLFLNAAGDTIYRGVTADQTAVDSIQINPGFVPRPTDQRVNFAITFQDYLPKYEFVQMHLSILFGSGLPTGPPSYTRYKDVFRMLPYRRVDIGFSARLKEEGKESKIDLFKPIQSAWLSLEIFNLLQVNNTISYLWIKDSRNIEYGVPNYLTSRRVNLKLILKF